MGWITMADGRQRTRPAGRRYRMVIVACPACGVGMTVSCRVRSARKCQACSLKAITDAATQMARKSGPFYEKWLASNGNPEVRLQRTTPPPEVSRETPD